MSGSRAERQWLPGEEGFVDFFDLKGVVEALLERLHVTGAVYEPAQHPTFQPGRTARLLAKGAAGTDGPPVVIGYLGELHPSVREAFDLPDQRVAAAELDLEALLSQVPPTWYVEEISPYPAVLQDLAVVVDEGVPAAEVGALIHEAGGFLLKEVKLFDVYRGDPIPNGRKSLAYALAFQAPDKTLRDAVAAKQVQRILKRLEQELGAELRA
jgi:phenylalanyl-tRNA synthetase beta chain